MTHVDVSPVRRRGRVWVAFTTAVAWVIFLQAVTAGRIFAGDEWARTAHRAVAGISFAVVLVASVVALVRLRAQPGGRRFALGLLALAVCLFVQEGLGSAAAEGRDTLWLHIPVGVAILALSLRTISLARQVHPADAQAPVPAPEEAAR